MTTVPLVPVLQSQPIKCPLCRKRPVRKKKFIYDHPVCKKCYYAFANRRQLAYLIDAIGIGVLSYFVNLVLVPIMQGMNIHGMGLIVAQLILNVPMTCLFVMKDGFGGRSPGKWMTGIQVLDEKTGLPISFAQSFKRNAILIPGVVPILGGLWSLVVIIIIVTQMARGYRLGDRFAGTRVIWTKFAELSVFGGKALVCENCGYDLFGNISGTCPECGSSVSERNAQALAIQAVANAPAVASPTASDVTSTVALVTLKPG